MQIEPTRWRKHRSINYFYALICCIDDRANTVPLNLCCFYGFYSIQWSERSGNVAIWFYGLWHKKSEWVSGLENFSYWSMKWYGGKGTFDTPGRLIPADQPQRRSLSHDVPKLTMDHGLRGYCNGLEMSWNSLDCSDY